MSDELETEFKGIGQWHAQAKRVEEDEPETDDTDEE